MIISASRTIVVATPMPTPWAPYIQPPLLQWTLPNQPQDVLDFSLDLTADMADSGDYFASIFAVMAPSNAPGVVAGPGYDAQPISISASGNVVTLWIAGGIPGRTSTAFVQVQTAMGRTFEYLANLLTSPWSGSWPLPAPYSAVAGPPQSLSLLVTAATGPFVTASGAYVATAESAA